MYRRRVERALAMLCVALFGNGKGPCADFGNALADFGNGVGFEAEAQARLAAAEQPFPCLHY